MRRESGEMLAPGITLKVHPEIAELLLGEEGSLVDSLEVALNKKIVVRPDPQFHLEQYEMYEMHKNYLDRGR
jgi:ribonuclease G